MRKFFFQPIKLERWVVVSFLESRRLSEDDVHEYVASLQEAMGKTGKSMTPFMADIKPVSGRIEELVMRMEYHAWP